MNIFDMILYNFILTSFSLILYLFYVAYNTSLEKNERKIFFELALFSTLYLLVKFGTDILIMINVPLVLSFCNKKKIGSLFIMIFVVLTYYFGYDINILFLLIEYGIYYFIFILFKKKGIYLIIFSLKCILYLLFFDEIGYYDSKIDIVVWTLVAIVTTFLVNFLVVKGKEIMQYHMHYKELIKDSQIKSSLFKITHEIKNPLAVCLGYIGMFDEKDINKSKEYISIIKDEINRSLLILQDFSNMGDIKLNLEIIDVEMLLEESINNYKPLLRDKKINIQLDYIDDDIYIEGDYNRLNQVIMNIIKNSAEAIETDGKIQIGINYDDDVIISFSDSGCGIDEDVLKKIKEPFFTTKKNGNGLGVALTYQIIVLHNGTVEYRSIKGEGTTVFIKLPRVYV